jgi:hypothetical protein
MNIKRVDIIKREGGYFHLPDRKVRARQLNIKQLEFLRLIKTLKEKL